MLKELAARHYLDGNHNCAEAVYLAVREARGLPKSPESLRLLSAYGGGLHSGRTCGALLGALAGLGDLRVQEKAHETPGFDEECRELGRRFEEALDNDQCAVLKPRHVVEGKRCLSVVATAADILEAYALELGQPLEPRA